MLFMLVLIAGIAGCGHRYYSPSYPMGPGTGIWDGAVEFTLSKDRPRTPGLDIEFVSVSSNAATIRFLRTGEELSAKEGTSFTNGLRLLRVDASKLEIHMSADISGTGDPVGRR